jgi:flavin-dependent trigonelline monooxygenase, oxygenase component
MRFAIAVNMLRNDPGESMAEVAANARELVVLADRGGFDIAWAAEHHCIELTVAPSPFVQLMDWAAGTERIRLGTAVVVAPYWHPIRLAGEAGLFDLYSGGRLELGLGRGAFQYEFDRMASGIPQEQGGGYLRELVPLLRALWQGDVAHEGRYWRFPTATALPRPLQQPHPPIWVAARGPETFEWSVEQGLDLMATPLSKPFAEVEALAARYREAVAARPEAPRPRFLVLRRTCVYDDPRQWREVAEAEYRYARRFAGLFQTGGEVSDGFPRELPPEPGSDRERALETIRENMIFGTPEEVVEKLRAYQAAGVGIFCYGACFGMPHRLARRSLELFIERVMPELEGTRAPALRQGV